MLMAAAVERCFEPGVHNFQRGLEGHHALAEGDDIGVVVMTAEARGLDVPAQRAANTLDAVGGDGLAVAGAAEDDAALAFAARDGLRHGPDEKRIIHGRVREGAEVTDLVAEGLEVGADLFLVLKSGVIGADANFHNVITGGKLTTKRAKSTKKKPMRKDV